MSLTFRQTRYQALYKDVQRLIEDTASIAVRKRPSLYMYASSPYRRNWLWKNKTIAIHAKIKDVHLATLLHKLLILVRAVAEYWRIPTKNDA